MATQLDEFTPHSTTSSTVWMTILTQKLLPWHLYSLEQLEGPIDEERIHSRAFLHEQVFDLEEKKQPVPGLALEDGEGIGEREAE